MAFARLEFSEMDAIDHLMAFAFVAVAVLWLWMGVNWIARVTNRKWQFGARGHSIMLAVSLLLLWLTDYFFPAVQ